MTVPTDDSFANADEIRQGKQLKRLQDLREMLITEFPEKMGELAEECRLASTKGNSAAVATKVMRFGLKIKQIAEEAK